MKKFITGVVISILIIRGFRKHYPRIVEWNRVREEDRVLKSLGENTVSEFKLEV